MVPGGSPSLARSQASMSSVRWSSTQVRTSLAWRGWRPPARSCPLAMSTTARSSLSVPSVDVRHAVVPDVHVDHDAVEGAESGHDDAHLHRRRCTRRGCPNEGTARRRGSTGSYRELPGATGMYRFLAPHPRLAAPQRVPRRPLTRKNAPRATGLQSPLPQFDSGRRLLYLSWSEV